MSLQRTKQLQRTKSGYFTEGDNVANRRFQYGQLRDQARLNEALKSGKATTYSPKQKVNVNDVNKKHNILKRTFYDGRNQLPLNEGQLDPKTAVYKTPENFYHLGLQYDNATTPPPNHLGAVKGPKHYGDHTDNKRLIPGNYGGKSKRRKSKTKSCCSVRKSAKVCRRKTDNKKFRLPRRFSRKTCLAKKPRGFTMRSSCAPYKGCKKTRKGGTKTKKRKREEKDPTEEEIFHLYDNPVSAKFMSELFENTDHLSEKDAGIYRENMEKNIIKQAKKLISNLSVEQQDMLLEFSKKIEEESRGGRKK